MHISRLALDDFRSWDHLVLDLPQGATILHGPNGIGKTNIVEAVEVLSTGASHRASGSAPLVRRGAEKATVRANLVEGERTATYEATIRAKGANRARINGGQSLYMRDIVGDIPTVSFTPDDQRIVSGDPSARRSFLDQAATLLDRSYAPLQQQFSHIARQRAALLKNLGSRSDAEFDQMAALSGLEIWTGQYIEAGVELTRKRDAVVGKLQEPFARLARRMAAGGAPASLDYAPSFAEVLEFSEPHAEISRHFQRLFAGETARGINLIGPQRDDLEVGLDGMPAREFASNGEMWTLALALKMALYETVRADRGEAPIVILDDVFAQLDESRRGEILSFAAAQPQSLITVAAASDIPELAGANVVDVAGLRGTEMP